MYINNISVNTRHNRPSVLSKTALLTYFINDGRYTDPHTISAVSIFKANTNFYPSAVIGSNGQIDNSASSLVLMNFFNSATPTSDVSYNVSNYAAANTGIFRLREGVFAVVLDSDATTGTFNLSGSTTLSNRVSATGDYIDVWTIKRTSGSNLDTVINEFTLGQDRFFNVTEPLLFRVATRLENGYLILGSVIDLKFTNEFTIENCNIDRSIVNLFKDSLVLNPMIEIYKENEDRNLPSRVTVSSFAQTSALCDVTSDNTVVFPFDTTLLSTHSQLTAGNLGSLTGVYVARLKFTALAQTLISNYISFTLR